MFTLSDLQDQATAASFSRGRAYFEEGAVGRIRHRADDNLFSATVSGSEKYTVELTLTGSRPDFWCDCPYDYEGICKHCVALGLAVLEEFGPAAVAHEADLPVPEKAPSKRNVAAPTPAATVSASALEAALREVPKPEQLKFLVLQLRQNPALASAFLTHFNGPPLPPDPLDDDPTLPRLEALRDELCRALSKLRFDYTTLADDSGQLPVFGFTYGQPLPSLLERIEAVLAGAFQPVVAAIEAALAAGQLAQALRRWHGAWLGIAAVKRPAADSYQLIGRNMYARRAADAWLRQLPDTRIPVLLRQSVFAPQETERCVPVLAQPVLVAARQLPSPAGVPVAWPDAGLPLLLAASANPTLAPALRTALQPYERQVPHELKMRLAAGCHDWLAWEPLAEQAAVQSGAVALELLRFYLERPTRRIDLRRAAAQHLARHAALVAPFILAYITPSENRRLYVKALTWRLETAREFSDFEELTGLWTVKERATFVQQVLEKRRARFSPLFRARVLVAEKRSAEILPLLLLLEWHPRPRTSYWSAPPPTIDLAELPELLRLAAHHDPEATLDAVMERVEQYLETKSRRSPELYERIGSWLKALHELPALTEQVTLFAEGLYAKYNKLTYLRRAVREAQLLPEPEPQPPKLPPAGTARPGRRPKNPFGR